MQRTTGELLCGSCISIVYPPSYPISRYDLNRLVRCPRGIIVVISRNPSPSYHGMARVYRECGWGWCCCCSRVNCRPSSCPPVVVLCCHRQQQEQCSSRLPPMMECHPFHPAALLHTRCCFCACVGSPSCVGWCCSQVPCSCVRCCVGTRHPPYFRRYLIWHGMVCVCL